MTTPKPSVRSEIPPFIVMDMLRASFERLARGEDVMHLEAGQPSTSAPRAVIDAAKSALDADKIGYTETLGMRALRERIARHYEEAYGVSVGPDRIIITTGSSCGFILSFLAAFDVGDAVALTTPGYPAYSNILRALGQVPLRIETGPESGFQPTADTLRRAAADGARGFLVASPANPTGTMISRTDLEAIAVAAAGEGVWLISDEIYHGITYDEPAATALAFNDDAIVVNSFSKFYSMTGWRIGWMVVPERLARPAERLAQSLFISAPTLSQFAALAAFDAEDELKENVAVYARNRQMLLDTLPGMGFKVAADPQGAFYLYTDVSALTNDSVAFCRRLLNETGAATTPGVDFDPERGSAYVRFSFAAAPDQVDRAIERLRSWLPV